MEGLYPIPQFSDNAQALARLALATPVITPRRINLWHIDKLGAITGRAPRQAQTLTIDDKNFHGYLKRVNVEAAYSELTAGLLAAQLGAPVAPCIVIADRQEPWLFSAETFADVAAPQRQHWFSGDAYLQGMAGQFAAFANDSARHKANHVYADNGALCLYDFEMMPSPTDPVRYEVMRWQLLNRPLFHGRRRRAYDRGSVEMAAQIASLNQDFIGKIVEAAGAILPNPPPRSTDGMRQGLLARQALFEKGPVKPKLGWVMANMLCDHTYS